MADSPSNGGPKPGGETPVGAKPENGERRRKALQIIGAFAGVVLLGTLLYVLINQGKEETDDAQVDADVVPLSPHVLGQVAMVPVAENQAVKKGEVVVQLDDRDYQAKVQQSQAGWRASGQA
jgi:membrane fusion protein (multidrug efflux system)